MSARQQKAYLGVEPEASEAGLAALRACRLYSESLAEPLSDEDQTVQASDDASPTKWHLAHTTWFFETFLLCPHLDGYETFSDEFAYCFNSYYETLGSRQPRAKRGLLTRPSANDVRRYRHYVDEALTQLLSDPEKESQLASLVALGINHEQQHQELLLTDILALFAQNPLRPAYSRSETSADHPSTRSAEEAVFFDFEGGIVSIGHEGSAFAYDNETPRHQTYLRPFRLADRCVTNANWLAFIADGGYGNPLLWLADGWSTVQREHWIAPGYWEQRGGIWHQMTLDGLRPVQVDCPVSHVSFYEADAFARWSGKRLPSEAEWEVAARAAGSSANDNAPALRPLPIEASPVHAIRQMFGSVWQWTASAYLPYPGYQPPAGAVGEYNGKFMCNQHVLRGSSCFTPKRHSRPTYRNFFYPCQRWQVTGLRLAEDA